MDKVLLKKFALILLTCYSIKNKIKKSQFYVTLNWWKRRAENSIDTKRDSNFYCADYCESFALFFVPLLDE